MSELGHPDSIGRIFFEPSGGNLEAEECFEAFKLFGTADRAVFPRRAKLAGEGYGYLVDPLNVLCFGEFLELIQNDAVLLERGRPELSSMLRVLRELENGLRDGGNFALRLRAAFNLADDLAGTFPVSRLQTAAVGLALDGICSPQRATAFSRNPIVSKLTKLPVAAIDGKHTPSWHKIMYIRICVSLSD